MIRRLVAQVVAGAMIAALGGCSVLLDWNDLTGDAGTGDDGGGGDAASTDGASEGATDGATESGPAICSGDLQCVPAAPAGWSIVELFTASTVQGAPPSCGAGFAQAAAFDGNSGLTAAAPTCSSCGCGTPAGATCDGPLMTFYIDTSCGNEVPVSGTETVSSTCNPTNPLAQSVTVAAPTVSGGTCTATGGVATTPTAVWAQVARACAPASPPSTSSCGSGKVCAPTPGSSFSTSSCVMQSGAATSCPAGYPTGPQVFYSGIDDERACSTCTCSAPTGAACTLGSPAIDSCVDTTTFNAPNACAPFTGGDPVKLAATPTLSTLGSCTATGGGSPTGSATPTGPTSFCCSP